MISKILKIQPTKYTGQSLVEIAIIAPLLVFMLIGLFEVGYVIRNQLIIDNISREAARFGARPQYDSREIVEHAYAVAHQIDPERIEAVIVSYIEIGPVLPCDPAGRRPPADGDYWPNCDCQLASSTPFSATVVTPAENPDLIYTWPETSTIQTRLDYGKVAGIQLASHAGITCQRYKQQPAFSPAANLSVTVEIFYRHSQLFGFPVISNPFTDPITLHSATTFRRLDIQRRLE